MYMEINFMFGCEFGLRKPCHVNAVDTQRRVLVEKRFVAGNTELLDATDFLAVVSAVDELPV